jgi:hypothetical protein
VRFQRHRDTADQAEIVVEAAKDDELREHAVRAASEVLEAFARLRTVKRRHERRRFGLAFGLAAGTVISLAALWRWQQRRGATRPDVAMPAEPRWAASPKATTPAAGSPPAPSVAPEAFRAESPDTQVGEPALGVDDLLGRRGQDVEDIAGEKIGTLNDVYLDEPTGAPEWAVVESGTLRASRWFVPLRGVQLLEGRIQVPFTRELVTSAPEMEADGRISPSDEHELYYHYGINRQEAFKVSR